MSMKMNGSLVASGCVCVCVRMLTRVLKTVFSFLTSFRGRASFLLALVSVLSVCVAMCCDLPQHILNSVLFTQRIVDSRQKRLFI